MKYFIFFSLWQSLIMKLIACIHVLPTPSSPKWAGNMKELIGRAIKEALIFREVGGIDGLILENMHDVPYIKGKVHPATISAMAVVAQKVKEVSGLPCGVQILAGANKEALSVAVVAGLDFIRVEGFVFGHIADEGYIEACAGELLRLRSQLKAENIKIFADIKKKHSAHAITSDVSLLETAKAAELFEADGIIVTGNSTGDPPDIKTLKTLKGKLDIPVLIGSGITDRNIEKYFPLADGFIVGSHFKKDNYWKNEVDSKRVGKFVKRFRKLIKNRKTGTKDRR